MLMQIPNRNRFIDMIMAMSFISSKGYQISLNENGFLCPVMAEDGSMNVVFKSNALSSFEVQNILKLSVPDIDSFKKFFKSLPSRDGVVEYDEHLNSITYANTKISLNGPDVIPGKVKPSQPLSEDWYRVEIEDVDPLYEMCSHTKLGERVEITNRKINLHTWDIKVSVTDAFHEEVGEEFKICIARDMLKTITRIHKKIGAGSMYINIFKDPAIPLIKLRGDGTNYVAYCGKYKEG